MVDCTVFEDRRAWFRRLRDGGGNTQLQSGQVPIGATVSAELHVDGTAVLYRLYDIGYAIDLGRAAELLGTSTRGRVRPTRIDARAIEIRNPPLLATLSTIDLTIAGELRRAMLSAHLFDFGVCSLQVRVPAPRGIAWGAFAELGEAIDSSSELGSVLEQALRDLRERLAPAVDRPSLAPLVEDYKIYRVTRVDRRMQADTPPPEIPIAESFSDEQLVALLIGERQRLSRTARRELVPYRFSYFEDDLAVLTWESALVVEPRPDDHDVEYILEFANAQLLELRMYDQRLDADLPALYDRADAARARRSPRFARGFRAVLSDLHTRVADITETVERVENALKVTNDVYLARVYGAALELFREQAWRRGIDRKLAILHETYAMLNGEAQAARAELLEVAIIALIIVELVVGMLRGSIA